MQTTYNLLFIRIIILINAATFAVHSACSWQLLADPPVGTAGMPSGTVIKPAGKAQEGKCMQNSYRSEVMIKGTNRPTGEVIQGSSTHLTDW